VRSKKKPKILHAPVVDVGGEAATDQGTEAREQAEATAGSEPTQPEVASATEDTGGVEPFEEGQGGGLWPVDRLCPVLEAVVFASADPLPVRRIREVIGGPTAEEIKAALCVLQADYAPRGMRLVEVAGGWQFRTAPEHHEIVRRLFKERPFKLTRAGIETLAVVAYRQPVTRAEVESVRGVDCSGVLESLVERHLIRIAGRRDVPGRPLVYTTTQEFLETFGLKDLKSLPTLPELGDEIRSMAEQSDFTSAEERDAAILPLETGDDNSGDQGEADRPVETTDPAAAEQEHAAAGERRSFSPEEVADNDPATTEPV